MEFYYTATKDDFVGDFEGEAGKFAQALLTKAWESAPCVVILDKCGSILKSRTSELSNINDPDRVNAILQEWDGMTRMLSSRADRYRRNLLCK